MGDQVDWIGEQLSILDAFDRPLCLPLAKVKLSSLKWGSDNEISMIVAVTPHLKWEIILGNNLWEENPALKDILFETSPVQRDQRFNFQPPLQNFEKRALAESNQANLIKSTAGGNIEKNQSLETYTSGRGDETNTEGGDAGASDSLTQADRLFMIPIGQPEQITYSSERQQ